MVNEIPNQIISIILNIIFITIVLSVSFFYFIAEAERQHINEVVLNSLDSTLPTVLDNIDIQDKKKTLTRIRDDLDITLHENSINENLKSGVVNILIILTAILGIVIAWFILAGHQIYIFHILTENIVIIVAIVIIEYFFFTTISAQYKQFKRVDTVNSFLDHTVSKLNSEYAPVTNS